MASEHVDILTNPFGLFPNGREVFEAFLDIPVSTFSIVVGGLFWAILLFLPLSGIDRRDQISGLTYALFLCFSGTVMMIALGSNDRSMPSLLRDMVLVFVIFLTAKFRWINRKAKIRIFKEIATEEGTK